MVSYTAGNRRIAVIGSGISGLSAAWLASRSNQVVLYEADHRLGGHSNTAIVPTAYGDIPVDTGFIVFNDKNYPNLVALFQHLNVPTIASDMSFAASIDDGRFEYSGTGLKGLLGQRLNIARPRFWRMLTDVLRFYREAEGLLKRPELEGLTLGEYLDRENYSKAFIEDHLLPMGAAIWSMTTIDMRAYPLHAFVRFFVHHGLILLKGRPRWRTVLGGSREYVSRLIADFAGEIRLSTPVARIQRMANGVIVTDKSGHADRFDDVIIATHANDALSMLGDADNLEREILGSFRYTDNIAVLHSDENLMPKRKSVWSSWNYIAGRQAVDGAPLCVTYWMNLLQDLDRRQNLFVTLNACREIREDKIVATYNYTHPLFDLSAMAAQKRIWDLQGRRNTFFCGAHFGSGFHEDGLQAGLAAAEAATGSRRPWQVADESGRIFSTPLLAAAE
ncbi:NADH-ubiquinone oxidoreductase subunit 6 [Rhizobium sp. Root149]|uniref:NAD(P)/FAD-dependent oxidoreductase n=1 Tax=Rhizobium sp. Root149 TaxID=1736473 RepID=UPI00071274AE|nr:FAD-dependent oxidoreductase [Rhizobium sp. Root149]KQZ50455.1 NADH-ubiquinone oxidoreductase subunit 6 [Rhizobium sp. Root149]